MGEYVTKDSGQRVNFSTGSRRDTNEGKWRIDLIWWGFLVRLGELLARGAMKYDVNNWMLGQPISRSYESALRHLVQWKSGNTEEDHLAAVCFNIMSIMYVVAKTKEAKLPVSLMMEVDKDGNPTDQYFECADMPTVALQIAIKDTVRQTIIIRLIQNLLADGCTSVRTLVRQEEGGFMLQDVENVLEELLKSQLLEYNLETRQYRYHTNLSMYAAHILEVLVRRQGRGDTYKFVRDATEQLMCANGIPSFNGGLFMSSLEYLVGINVVDNGGDKRDGSYSV